MTLSMVGATTWSRRRDRGGSLLSPQRWTLEVESTTWLREAVCFLLRGGRRRFGDCRIFIGNLKKPMKEVRPKLEKKIAEAAGTEVTLWFMEEKNDDITKQVTCCWPAPEPLLHSYIHIRSWKVTPF